MIFMSRNISDENLLMNIQLEEPTIELPKAKEERTVENATLNNEEAFLVGRNPVIEDELAREVILQMDQKYKIDY